MALLPQSSPENSQSHDFNGENLAAIPTTAAAAWNTTFNNSDVVAPPVMRLEYRRSLSSAPDISYPVSNTISFVSTSSQASAFQNTRPAMTTANTASSVYPPPNHHLHRPWGGYTQRTPWNGPYVDLPPSSPSIFYPFSNTISPAPTLFGPPAFQNASTSTTTADIASSFYTPPNHHPYHPRRSDYNYQRVPWNRPYISRPPPPPPPPPLPLPPPPPLPPLFPPQRQQPARQLPSIPFTGPVYTNIYNYNNNNNDNNNNNKNNNNPVFVPRPSASSNVSVPDTSSAATSDLPARIVHQINYYFSDENLINDDHLKALMNDEGWVSVLHIANFRRLKAMTNDITLILKSMMTSTEVEEKDYKLRKRRGWEKYINKSKKEKKLS